MRFQLLLIPAAIIGAATPATAKVFMMPDEARARLFPGATFAATPLTLTESQSRNIGQEARAAVHTPEVKAWRVSSGGWFIVDQVEGKDDWVTYAVALSPDGAVQGIEILECAADYDTVTMPRWRAQFLGAKPGDKLSNVQTISGSTLSSRHITEGVRRILSTYALVLKNRD